MVSVAICTALQSFWMDLPVTPGSTVSVSVNGGMCIAPDLPFGGYKRSGIGREWGREGIEEFLEMKAIAIGA